MSLRQIKFMTTCSMVALLVYLQPVLASRPAIAQSSGEAESPVSSDSSSTTETAKAPSLRGDLNEEIIMVPVTIHERQYKLEMTLYRPNKTDRFPLIVMVHGTDSPPPGVGLQDYHQPRARFLPASQVFVKMGYAVAIPMRRGYGASEGEKLVQQNNDLTSYGLESALDIQAVVRYLLQQPYVNPNRVIVAGQSTGGLTTMAYISFQNEGILGAINMHGGWRPKNFTDDPLLQARIDAFSTYAKTTHIPSIWFYTANDHSSRPPFISKLRAAYGCNGGNALVFQLGPFKKDGHTLFDVADGVPYWLPRVKGFLSMLYAPDPGEARVLQKPVSQVQN